MLCSEKSAAQILIQVKMQYKLATWAAADQTRGLIDT